MTAVAIERRGIHSFTPIPADLDAIDKRTRCRDEWGAISKTDRVDDVVDAVESIRGLPWAGPMIVLGHSEGVDVTTGVSRRLGDGRVAAIGLLAGASPSQFLDSISLARGRQDLAAVESLFNDLVWLTSDDASGKYGGYPVKRWQSFAVESTPMEDVRDSTIPIFIANGIRDDKATIASAAAFALEALRRQPHRVVLYSNYPDLEHDFVDANAGDHSREVFEKFVRWALDPKKDRGFRIETFASPAASPHD